MWSGFEVVSSELSASELLSMEPSASELVLNGFEMVLSEQHHAETLRHYACRRFMSYGLC